MFYFCFVFDLSLTVKYLSRKRLPCIPSCRCVKVLCTVNNLPRQEEKKKLLWSPRGVKYFRLKKQLTF